MKRPTNMRPNLSFIAAINSNLIPHNVNAFLDNFKELLLSTTLENYNDIEKIESFKKMEFFFFLFRLSGLSPFMGDTDLETMANVTIAEYDYEDEAFNNVSDQAKKFVDKLLVKTKE